MFTSPTLGPLLFDPTEPAWIAFLRLPVLQSCAQPVSSPPSESVEEILAWLHERRQKLEEPDLTPQRTAQDDFEDWDCDQPPTRQEVRQRVWSRWIDKLVRARRVEGLLRVQLVSQEEVPPRPIQEQTIRHLIEHESAIVAAIRAALARSCPDYGIEASHAQAARIASISIHDDGLDDIAPIRFGIDCDWEVEHGMIVVYHPRTGAEWGTAGDDFDLVAAACPPIPPAPPPTPEEELVMAIFSRDQARTDELLAQGIRAEPSSGSALFDAIHERDVEFVKKLLAAGANPNRVDDYEGTPLQAARRALAEGTLTLPKRAPWLMKSLAFILKGFQARTVRRERRNGEAVHRLLVDAGAR